MATTTDGSPAPASAPPPSYADLILNPPTPATPHEFTFTPFLLREYRFGLPASRKACPAFLQGHCPLGNTCPDRHTTASSYSNLVCKHWLRSLCKKGETCEFLHEYNLRKMPECNFFVRHGYCSNGEECLYLHVDPDSKVPLCPHYEAGFCPLGPVCAKKHVRRLPLCPFYLAGFCPEGRKNCKEGSHPRWVDPKTLAAPAAKRPREEVERPPAPEWEERERDKGGFRDGGRGGGGSGGGFYGGRKRWGDRGGRR